MEKWEHWHEITNQRLWWINQKCYALLSCFFLKEKCWCKDGFGEQETENLLQLNWSQSRNSSQQIGSSWDHPIALKNFQTTQGICLHTRKGQRKG